ncbi:MAG: alpha-amylase family glycosyl hydrolase, partial [Elusimicrobia bacterium]|nr:alpha-amylase family glycosyl hydrolase [Elusimicrobiota bacterium]
EGFLYSKLELQSEGAAELDPAQWEDYFRYLDALLRPFAWTAALRRELAALKDSAASPEDNRSLDARLIAAVRDLQAQLRAADAANWFRGSGVYMILARAYNRTRLGRSFFDSLDEAELKRIREATSADVIWLLDIFEIGEVRRWGTGGGSPYAIKGYKIKSELGGEEAFRRFVRRAHAAGFKIGVDEIPNHVSLDSDLVKAYPEALIHLVPPQHLSKDEMLAQAPPFFYFLETDRYPENGRRVRKKILVHYPRTGNGDESWIDMAQRDYSQPVARGWEVAEATRLVSDLGVDVLRRDMAYYITNAYYYDTWLKYLRQERDRARGWARAEYERFIAGFQERRGKVQDREILEDATYVPKRAKPAAAMFDEAYGFETDLSAAGSDGVYNKNDHDAALGQIGLYDALASRDAARIRAALKNVAFRAWQRGGSAAVNFIGTHDGGEGNPVDKFGRFLKAAALTALLLRPVLIYNGLEQGVGQRDNLIGHLDASTDRQKAIPFDIPVSINWEKSNPAAAGFLKFVLAKSAEYRGLFERGAMDVLEPSDATPLAAYSVSAVSGRTRRTVLAAANFSEWRSGGAFSFRTGLAAFGAFRPEPDKNYILRDLADLGPDGGPRTYSYSGRDLAEKGLYLELDGGGVHLFEIEEAARR